MSQYSRTQMSQRNFTVSIISRALGMITSFAGRSIFIKILTSEYLGLGGFFANIFSLAALCELGMGAAICQSLYKPLASKDENRVSAIMNFYGKVNRAVALVTLVISLAAMPLLSKMTKSCIETQEMLCAYLLFSLHTAMSYVLAPKKNLVVCDQRMYVVTAVNTVSNVVALAVQSAVLIMTESYIGYLTARIFIITLKDLLINRYADRKYPFLGRYSRLDKSYYSKLKINVKALLWHKIGGVLCRSTDSLLISSFAGLAGMGMYSNYALVIGTVGSFFDAAMNGVQASVGNLGAWDRGERSEKIMRKMYFLNFVLLTVGLSVLVCTVNPLIRLWLGEKMLLSEGAVWVICLSFYLSCIRDPVQIFLNSYGMFKETRLIPTIRAGVNLVLSVLFVKRMGITGVFLGTALSTATVPLYFEVKMLYKYGFGNMSPTPFLKEMLRYIFVSLATAFLCFCVTSYAGDGVRGLIIKGALSVVISLLVIFCAYSKSEYFEFCTCCVRKLLHKRKNVAKA